MTGLIPLQWCACCSLEWPWFDRAFDSWRRAFTGDRVATELRADVRETPNAYGTIRCAGGSQGKNILMDVDERKRFAWKRPSSVSVGGENAVLTECRGRRCRVRSTATAGGGRRTGN